jgi:hypothetical protein
MVIAIRPSPMLALKNMMMDGSRSQSIYESFGLLMNPTQNLLSLFLHIIESCALTARIFPAPSRCPAGAR